jgi:hypothetical protein
LKSKILGREKIFPDDVVRGGEGEVVVVTRAKYSHRRRTSRS